MIAIYTLFFNFARQHNTLRMSPAMAAETANTLWGMEDIAALCEAKGPVNKGRIKERDEMRWEARTAFKGVAIGTIFEIGAFPQGEGQGADVLPSETDIYIDNMNDPQIKARIVDATSDVATLEMPDGSRWVLKPTTLDSSIRMPNFHTQTWVVSSVAKTKG